MAVFIPILHDAQEDCLVLNQTSYRKITESTRRIVSHLPLGEQVLRLPTLLCAAVYVFAAVRLLINRDQRLLPFLVIPAVCFLAVTFLRKAINRTRPYDAFHLPPVGHYQPGKGKSMPSRHAASAVAILMALLSLNLPVYAGTALILLTIVICLLRIASGHHYPGDVLAGALLSIALSLVLFSVFSRLMM